MTGQAPEDLEPHQPTKPSARLDRATRTLEKVRLRPWCSHGHGESFVCWVVLRGRWVRSSTSLQLARAMNRTSMPQGSLPAMTTTCSDDVPPTAGSIASRTFDARPVSGFDHRRDPGAQLIEEACGLLCGSGVTATVLSSIQPTQLAPARVDQDYRACLEVEPTQQTRPVSTPSRDRSWQTCPWTRPPERGGHRKLSS